MDDKRIVALEEYTQTRVDQYQIIYDIVADGLCVDPDAISALSRQILSEIKVDYPEDDDRVLQ